MARKKKGNYRRFDIAYNMDVETDAHDAALFDALRKESGQSVRAFVSTLLHVYVEHQDAPDAIQLVRELGRGLAEGLHTHAPTQSTLAPTPATTPDRTEGAQTTREVVSGGIDMSDRPRRAVRVVQQPEDLTANVDDIDEAALAQELIRSIGSFGQEQ